MRLFISLFLISINALAVSWNDLERDRTYKLNQSFVKPNIININTKVGLLTDKTIVMTGFRDKNLEEKIKSAGGKIGAGVSKNTFVVIVKHLDEDTSKVSDAKKNGIKLITVDEFNNKYLINNK
jgi:NAD-dependent DNA ligase